MKKHCNPSVRKMLHETQPHILVSKSSLTWNTTRVEQNSLGRFASPFMRLHRFISSAVRRNAGMLVFNDEAVYSSSNRMSIASLGQKNGNESFKCRNSTNEASCHFKIGSKRNGLLKFLIKVFVIVVHLFLSVCWRLMVSTASSIFKMRRDQ